MNDAPIGIFDSGMGGLTVMRALKARLPQEENQPRSAAGTHIHAAVQTAR